MAEPPDSVANALHDRYTLQRELGRGGMAVVYLAHDVRHARPVALKILHPDIAAALGPDRFLREIQLTASLQHPHILPIHDSGEAAGRLWYTMPYFAGESLRERLKRESQLPVDDVLQIGRNILAALSHAHRHGIVHRDIKPENVLLETGEAVLADFGIARAIDAAGAERLTQTGMAVGTPVYMSPEQATGSRELDARSDLYSVGCVLYEMLAGHPPFMGTSQQEILRRHVMDPVPPLRSARSEVPESLDRAIAKALAKAPADRWSGAQQFAEALRQPGPVAGRPSRLRLTLGALAVAAVAIAGVFAASRRSEAPPPGIPRLAVLPFENLGDSADAYFAGGVTDEIRGKLAAMPGLEVVASPSSNEYRGSTRGLPEVARELGADYLLVGKILWQRRPEGMSRVRVNPELIRFTPGAPPTTRWQQPIDAAITDVFAVQADIAGKVAEALGVVLGDSARRELTVKPTESLAAYDEYLKGEASAQGMKADQAGLRRAIGHFELAVSLDSRFAQAWSQLSRARTSLYSNGVPDPTLADSARTALRRARRLRPGDPLVYLAAGDFYSSVNPMDPERAMAELLSAAATAAIRLQRWDGILPRLDRALHLDPRSATVARRIATVNLYLRHYPAADSAADRAIALAPTNPTMVLVKVMVAVARGDLAGARAVVRAAAGRIDAATLFAFLANYPDLYWVLDDAQQQWVKRLPPWAFDDDRAVWGLVQTGIAWVRGEPHRVAAYADSARLTLTAQVRATPDDAQRHAMLGLALAYLGRKEEAIREGRRGVELLPIERDGLQGPYVQLQLVRIYLLTGERERALDQVEPLLHIPFYLSPGWLRIDPAFEPVRTHPRFERLFAGTG